MNLNGSGGLSAPGNPHSAGSAGVGCASWGRPAPPREARPGCGHLLEPGSSPPSGGSTCGTCAFGTPLYGPRSWGQWRQGPPRMRAGAQCPPAAPVESLPWARPGAASPAPLLEASHRPAAPVEAIPRAHPEAEGLEASARAPREAFPQVRPRAASPAPLPEASHQPAHPGKVVPWAHPAAEGSEASARAPGKVVRTDGSVPPPRPSARAPGKAFWLWGPLGAAWWWARTDV